MRTLNYPRVPLKEMDAASLVFELSRETDRVITCPEGREMITSAAMMATHLHRKQTRRVRAGLPRVPYIEHPLRNALRIIRWGATHPFTITAALLHDVIEDCLKEILTLREGVTLAVETELSERTLGLRWLADGYDPIVADAVDLVSNAPGSGTADYLPHMESLTQLAQNEPGSFTVRIALLVKAADLVDNAGSLKHQLAAGEDLAVILRLAKKYRPVLPLVINALREVGVYALRTDRARHSSSGSFELAARDLELIQDSLDVIIASLEQR